MTNQELLFELNEQLLTTIEKQERFLLRQAYAKVPCPNCACKQNQFEAARVAIDDWKFDKSDDARTYTCIQCERELKVSVPLFSPGAVRWHWRLVPIAVANRA